MKALVLGSSGFLGSYLGFALPRLGWDTHGASRGEAPWFPHNRGGCSPENMEDQVRSGGYDVVINAVAIASHEACEADPENALRVNSEWPGRWAAAAGDGGSQFVHVSTDAVFDGSSESDYREDDPANPLGVYGQTKHAGERAVLDCNSAAFVARANFFGWSRSGSVGILDFFVSAFAARRAITGFTDYRVSSLYVGHLTAVIAAAVEKKLSGIYHTAAAHSLSKFDFGLAVAEQWGFDAGVMMPGLVGDAAHLGARGKNLGLSSAKIELAVGAKMASSRDGLQLAAQEKSAVMDYFGVSEERRHED